MIALDTSALLAYPFTESSFDAVAEHIGTDCLSSVNLADVIFVLTAAPITQSWCTSIWPTLALRWCLFATKTRRLLRFSSCTRRSLVYRWEIGLAVRERCGAISLP